MTKKEQTVWDNQPQQKEFAKKVAALIEKKFGSIVRAKYQGAGEIAILVLTGKSISGSKMEQLRNFLTDVFKFELHKITKNHSHTKGTIVIHISEISNESRKIIEDEFHLKVILPKSLENKKLKLKEPLSILSSSFKIEEPKIIHEEITETKNPAKMEKFSIIKKGRNLLLSFLTAMFRFEGIIFDAKDRNFEFDEKMNDDCQSVSFRNEAEAEMAYSAIGWLHKATCKDLPVLEGKEVMVNFFSLNLEREIRPANISFCHPPVKGDSVERIQKRAARVLAGYWPSHVYIIDENSFSIGYARQATTQNFLELISRMGWEARMKEDVIICNFRPKPEVPEVTTSIVESVSKTEEVIPVVVETENKIFKENFTSPRSVASKRTKDQPKVETLETKKHVEQSKNQPEEVIIPNADSLVESFVSSQTEALVALKKLYSNKVLFSRISPEVQKEIITEIRNNFIEEHTEDYAKSLLAFFKK